LRYGAGHRPFRGPPATGLLPFGYPNSGLHHQTSKSVFHLHILHSLDLDLDLGAPAGGGVEFALPSVRPSARGEWGLIPNSYVPLIGGMSWS